MTEPQTDVYIGPIEHSKTECGDVCSCWCEACTKDVHGAGAERIEALGEKVARWRELYATVAADWSALLQHYGLAEDARPDDVIAAKLRGAT